MMKCIAIDDEPLALELLVDNISKVPFLELIAACDSPLEGMKLMEQHKVDLIFLDIQMPGLTGLQFIQTMTIKPIIILITAYEKYALDGFNLDVTDYLVKPVSLERFIKACNKANEIFSLRSNPKTDIPSNENSFLFVNVEYSLVKVIVADIVYIEGLKDYIKIHLHSSGRPVITRMTIKAIEEQLPAKRFVRIHKSYIVSIDYVTAMRKASVFIDKLELPLGENYRGNLINLTGN